MKKIMKLIGLIGLAGLVGLAALVYLGHIDSKAVLEPGVSVPGMPFIVPTVVVAVAVDAFLLSRRVRVIFTWLAGLLVLALGGTQVIEATSAGAQFGIPLVAQASGSDFVAMTVSLYLVLLLAFLTMMLFLAQFRLAVLGWARNRLVST